MLFEVYNRTNPGESAAGTFSEYSDALSTLKLLNKLSKSQSGQEKYRIRRVSGNSSAKVFLIKGDIMAQLGEMYNQVACDALHAMW